MTHKARYFVPAFVVGLVFWGLAGAGCLSPDYSKACREGESECYQGEVCYQGKCVPPSEVPNERDTSTADGTSEDAGSEPEDTMGADGSGDEMDADTGTPRRDTDAGTGRDTGPPDDTSDPDTGAKCVSPSDGLKSDTGVPCEVPGSPDVVNGKLPDGRSLGRPGDSCSSNDGTRDCVSGTCTDGACAARIFATARLYKGDLGGLGCADKLCDTLADRANLSGRWKAALATRRTSIDNRFNFSSDVAVYTVLGSKVFETVPFPDQPSDGPPIQDQCAFDVPNTTESFAWTGDGSSESGTPPKDCRRWRSSSGAYEGYVGNPYENKWWKYSTWMQYQPEKCSGRNHFYCVSY